MAATSTVPAIPAATKAARLGWVDLKLSMWLYVLEQVPENFKTGLARSRSEPCQAGLS